MLIDVPDCPDDVLKALIEKWAARAAAHDDFASAMAASLMREAARRQARSTLTPATDFSALPTMPPPSTVLSTLAPQVSDKPIHRAWRDTQPQHLH